MRLLICCYLIAKLISSAQITNCNLMHQRNFIIVHLMASLFYAKWPKDTSIFTIHVAFTTYFGLLLCDTLSNLQFNLPDKDFLSLFKRQKEKIVGTWGRCRSTLKRASLSVTNLFIFSQLFFCHQVLEMEWLQRKWPVTSKMSLLLKSLIRCNIDWQKMDSREFWGF